VLARLMNNNQAVEEGMPASKMVGRADSSDERVLELCDSPGDAVVNSGSSAVRMRPADTERSHPDAHCQHMVTA
jgi:hypothetical protein